MEKIKQVSKNRVECDQCDKSFVHRTSLIRHIKSHDQDKQSFSCEKCKFVTNGLDTLARHRRLIHDTFCINLDALRKSGNANFECKMCERSIVSEALLRTILCQRLARQGI